ncbi:hypothetical protein LAZ67_3004305 [Cordylochernes scorpioides]|uniref:Uncharacterized protein n=1 Tax=Cordylochernes scorpioides TaxID=51811 RepID=A0ABY6K975_9ARAC|nr:hypothetical protein LAZ67_3004305 [Cordylochernes scorpioides]
MKAAEDYIEKVAPGRASDLFNDTCLTHFRNILRGRKKQTSLDMFFSKRPTELGQVPMGDIRPRVGRRDRHLEDMHLIVTFSLVALTVGGSLAYMPRGYYDMEAPVMEQQVYEEPPKPYSYGYNIDDGYDNRHYHNEDSDALGHKKGSYGYTSANGLYRTVNYVADDQGYRAQIMSNEPGIGPEGAADVELKVNPVPASIQAEMEILRILKKPESYPQMESQLGAMNSAYQPEMQAMKDQASYMKPMPMKDIPILLDMAPAKKPLIPVLYKSEPASEMAPSYSDEMKLPVKRPRWMAARAAAPADDAY